MFNINNILCLAEKIKKHIERKVKIKLKNNILKIRPVYY